MLDLARLERAYQRARADLLAERTPAGHWVGELSSSALSTATAVSALSLLRPQQPSAEQPRFTSLIESGLRWIYDRQNADGGLGDTDKSVSNISTTMLVRAATHLAGQADHYRESLRHAEQYIEQLGGIPGLRRRYGKDKTFAVPILTNYALAGLVPWSEVSPLPFEAACLPQSWYRFARLPVVSYAIPALVAIGQARYFKQPPRNPVMRLLRRWAIEPSLRVLSKMQPASGGYLEATPLTSFVVMSLAGTGRHDHPVTRLGLKFLLDSVRTDGSWPIDTNLATWVTTLAINALNTRHGNEDCEHLTPQLLAWLLGCQHTERHPFTGAAPGGWGWSDLSGAVPDADDTPGALLALQRFVAPDEKVSDDTEPARVAEQSGRDWLLGLQNGDGGWPTFCRGWGVLPFDRSGTDLTAHALRAIEPWTDSPDLRAARDRGRAYLARTQRPDGSWLPLWFGNQARTDDENPLYGTARVLFAYRDLRLMHTEPAQRAIRFLLAEQNADGGWGGGPVLERGQAVGPLRSSVEETALVVEALLADESNPAAQALAVKGLSWLVEAVESNQHQVPSPIGFYFAKLWYYEKLYPIIFTVSALGHALACLQPPASPRAELTHPH
ncbi:MAG: squalene--hopene cyclase [Planctomycetaceae bacterium]|nr:squalene--hopene cyclase [Planctomycetaceae bacterium]